MIENLISVKICSILFCLITRHSFITVYADGSFHSCDIARHSSDRRSNGRRWAWTRVNESAAFSCFSCSSHLSDCTHQKSCPCHAHSRRLADSCACQKNFFPAFCCCFTYCAGRNSSCFIFVNVTDTLSSGTVRECHFSFIWASCSLH